MAPRAPNIDFEELETKLESVFNMMEKHIKYVDELVDRINVEVDDKILPREVFRNAAHKIAKNKGMFEYKIDKQIEKSKKIYRKVLRAFVILLIGFILSLFFTLIVTALFEDSNKETPIKEPTQIEKIITPDKSPSKTGPVFREIK